MRFIKFLGVALIYGVFWFAILSIPVQRTTLFTVVHRYITKPKPVERIEQKGIKRNQVLEELNKAFQ